MQQINPFEYNYKKGETVEIEGNLLHALISWLKQLEERETEMVFLHTYNTSAEEIKSPEGIITHIDLETKEYPSMNSYMTQRPTKATSIDGAIAFDFINSFSKVHLENIEKGRAIKIGTFETEKDEEVKFS